MRIFVTGATGFIGRAFCAAARRRGHELLGLCRTADTGLDCEIAVGSLQEMPWQAVENFQPEAALHLAWIATPGIYLTAPENDRLVVQSQELIRGLAERGVTYVAGTGTCIEYAASSAPLREADSPLSPTYPYSQAKAALARWLTETGPALHLRTSWLRIFYPYGPGEHSNRLPSMIIRKLAAGQVMELRTPGSIKDYIYVDDLAECFCMILEAGLTGPVNIGTGSGIRLTELALTIARVLDAAPSLVTSADPVTLDPWPVQIADPSRLRAIGWHPRTDLAAGMTALAQSILASS